MATSSSSGEVITASKDSDDSGLSLIEYCVQLDDYTPTVRELYRLVVR